MKQQDAFILSIPNPCTQPWNEMLPDKDGRFCLSCQKKVVDFTEMTDAALLAYLKNNKGNSCGRFDTTQLNRVVQTPVEPLRSFFPAILLSTMLTAILPEQVYGNNKTPDVTIQPSLQLIHVERSIQGCITDERGDALDGVSIRIKGRSYAGAITDGEGKFTLKLPESLLIDPVTLQISRIGYDAQELSVSPDQFSDLRINLKLSMMILPEIVIEKNGWTSRTEMVGAMVSIRYCRNPRWHWWHKLTRVFRKNKFNQ